MLLHLLAHAIKKTKASAAGSRLKKLACENCQTEYWYFLSRTGVGQASSFVLSDGSARARRAQIAAEQNLAKRLDRETEQVPCPHCHWINQDLVSSARRRKFRGLHVLAFVILVLGGLAYPLVASVAESNSRTLSDEPTILAAKVSAGFVVAAITIFALQYLLRRRINPNRHFPLPPRVVPGTPPAMVLAGDPPAGARHLELADVSYPSSSRYDRWAILRPTQLVFPRTCCFCLKDTPSIYKPRLRVNTQSNLPVPFCDECKRTFRPIWQFTAFLSIGVFAAIGGIVAIATPDLDEVGRWAMGSSITLFGSIFGLFIIPNLVCRPFRFGTIDKDRGIVKFASKNEAFTQLLRDQAQQSEALLASQTMP